MLFQPDRKTQDAFILGNMIVSKLGETPPHKGFESVSHRPAERSQLLGSVFDTDGAFLTPIESHFQRNVITNRCVRENLAVNGDAHNV